MKMLVALWSRETHDVRFGPDNTAARFGALSLAVQTAAARMNRIASLRGSAIQCVFVAPEYLFTELYGNVPGNAHFLTRAMSDAGKQFVLGRLQLLSRTHPSILMVPGTVAWKKPFARVGAEQFKKNPRTGLRTAVPKAEGRDVKAHRSLIRQGAIVGDPGGPHAVWRGDQTPTIAEKRADITANVFTHMMRNTAYVLHKGRVHFKYNKQGDFHEAIGDATTVFVPGDQVGTCVIEGVRFGFEICLDHNMSVLQRRARHRAVDPVQVHIITSAAVDNVSDNAHVTQRGYVVHASSVDACTTVYQPKQGRGQMVSLGHDNVDGDPLRYWLINV
jgi:hypothetical protein